MKSIYLTILLGIVLFETQAKSQQPECDSTTDTTCPTVAPSCDPNDPSCPPQEQTPQPSGSDTPQEGESTNMAGNQAPAPQDGMEQSQPATDQNPEQDNPERASMKKEAAELKDQLDNHLNTAAGKYWEEEDKNKLNQLLQDVFNCEAENCSIKVFKEKTKIFKSNLGAQIKNTQKKEMIDGRVSSLAPVIKGTNILLKLVDCLNRSSDKEFTDKNQIKQIKLKLQLAKKCSEDENCNEERWVEIRKDLVYALEALDNKHKKRKAADNSFFVDEQRCENEVSKNNIIDLP